ncbi:hypothetical protein ScPMuIL_015488 [Solemya velum]
MSDIFVALPPMTAYDQVIFGKNSDRPPSEVQEVVYQLAVDHPPGSSIKCTFEEVEQVSHTYATALSKPAWAWGAEMGANECGVCIGNTAVWTKLCHPGDHVEKLLGIDLVRLGLERSASSQEAVHIIGGLLEKYGQGGLCTEDHSFGQWTHDSAFLIADNKEVWVMETAGQFWAAMKVSEGIHNISSTLSIGSTIDAMSADLKEGAQAAGYWKPEDGEFNFAKVFGAEYTGLSLSEIQLPENRLKSGHNLLTAMSKEGKIKVWDIFEILRDENSSINFSGDIMTVASQVSALSPPNSKVPHCHWFTATPNPMVSVFKPFVFCPESTMGSLTTSPTHGDRTQTGFQATGDRRHTLYRAHEKARKLMESDNKAGERLKTTMKELEKHCVQDVQEFLQNLQDSKMHEIHDLFEDVTDSELKFYR